MRFLLFLLLAGSILSAWADVLEGRVVSVGDGDTITLLDGNRQQHRIRIAAKLTLRHLPARDGSPTLL